VIESRILYVQIKAILRWIRNQVETLPAKGYEQAFGVWSGQDFLPILDKDFGISESTLQLYKVWNLSGPHACVLFEATIIIVIT